jgi:hypothetical protein
MKFGVREICDVVFKAKTSGKLGTMEYVPGQPVLYIDTAKTSTLEGASTTVYATGGKGNSRLIAWEGERTLTFTVEDALLSPIGFAILSGAGLMDASESAPIYVHVSSVTHVGKDGVLDLVKAGIIKATEKLDGDSPIFVMEVKDGSMVRKLDVGEIADDATSFTITGLTEATDIFVDFYVERKAAAKELTIDMGNFAGYYYVEASTLFRRQSDGYDLPAELIFPNVKVQSNFTFSMAPTGDPSTFTFTMDAMPGYTRFDRSKKVLCAMQIMDDSVDEIDGIDSATLVADDDLEYPLFVEGE